MYRDGGLEERSISLSQCTYVMPVNKRSFSICFQNLRRFKMDVTEEEIKDPKEPKEVKSFRRSKGGKIGKTWDPLDG